MPTPTCWYTLQLESTISLPPRDVRFGTQDFHLTQMHHTITYKRVTALDREGPPTNPWPTLLSGEKHDGSLAGDGTTGLVHRCGGLHGHSAIWLDRDNLTPVNEGDTTRTPRELFPQQLGPPRGLSVAHSES